MTNHHEVTGNGPALLLVHAGVADSRMWTVQRDDLARDHTVITLDLRGYGETPLAAGAEYSDAADVLDLLDELGLETVSAVAASYGGNVVLQAASHRPDRFERLVLFAPPVDGVERTDDIRAFGAEEDRLLDAGDIDAATELNVTKFLGPEADEATRVLLRKMQKRAFELQLAAGDVQNNEFPVEPKKLEMPVTVFTGAHDSPYFTACGIALADSLPNAELHALSWAGHLPTLERPVDGTALIRASL